MKSFNRVKPAFNLILSKSCTAAKMCYLPANAMRKTDEWKLIWIFRLFYRNYFHKLFGRPIGPFFRFVCPIWQEDSLLHPQSQQILKKSKKCTLLLSILIFQFCFFSVFFWIPITFKNFVAELSGHFFRFFVLYGKKMHFLMSNIAQFC